MDGSTPPPIRNNRSSSLPSNGHGDIVDPPSTSQGDIVHPLALPSTRPGQDGSAGNDGVDEQVDSSNPTLTEPEKSIDNAAISTENANGAQGVVSVDGTDDAGAVGLAEVNNGQAVRRPSIAEQAKMRRQKKELDKQKRIANLKQSKVKNGGAQEDGETSQNQAGQGVEVTQKSIPKQGRSVGCTTRNIIMTDIQKSWI